jgi:hypothetical protein
MVVLVVHGGLVVFLRETQGLPPRRQSAPLWLVTAAAATSAGGDSPTSLSSLPSTHTLSLSPSFLYSNTTPNL